MRWRTARTPDAPRRQRATLPANSNLVVQPGNLLLLRANLTLLGLDLPLLLLDGFNQQCGQAGVVHPASVSSVLLIADHFWHHLSYFFRDHTNFVFARLLQVEETPRNCSTLASASSRVWMLVFQRREL